MLVVSVEESGPLLGADPQACLHGNTDDLGIVLPSQRFVRTKLEGESFVKACDGGGGREWVWTYILFELHKGGIVFLLLDLGGWREDPHR